MTHATFRDRAEAGRLLAEALAQHAEEDPLVLGLARGGVPVAAEVARALGAELDVVVARKLGAPGHEELGLGAIAPGARVLDEGMMRSLGVDAREIERIEAREREELTRRIRAYRGGRAPPRLHGRTVLVVDDGVATGGTACAALRSVRGQGAARVVFAAPVGPPDVLPKLKREADRVEILRTPEPFRAVGLWYDDFGQTSDEEVMELLREVHIRVGGGTIAATLDLPEDPIGLVVFAHGSGSSRHSPRERWVAGALQERGLATLVLDLLTPAEAEVDERTRKHRFDVRLLADRLVEAARWAGRRDDLGHLRVGLFGASTGAGAALVAAAADPSAFAAVVGRGGRPDLAGDALPAVRAPTLLLVGGRDEEVIRLNEEARDRMAAPVEISIVPGATHLFEEPGALAEVAGRTADFFASHLAPRARDRERRSPALR